MKRRWRKETGDKTLQEKNNSCWDVLFVADSMTPDCSWLEWATRNVVQVVILFSLRSAANVWLLPDCKNIKTWGLRGTGVATEEREKVWDSLFWQPKSISFTRQEECWRKLIVISFFNCRPLKLGPRFTLSHNCRFHKVRKCVYECECEREEWKMRGQKSEKKEKSDKNTSFWEAWEKRSQIIRPLMNTLSLPSRSGQKSQ